MVHFSNPKGVDIYAFGGDIKPTAPSVGETTDQQLRAFTKNLPTLSAASNANILPNEQAQVDASRIVSPQYTEINRDIYDTYGRDLNRIGSEISRDNAMAQAQTDADVLQGPGMDLVRSGLEAAKIFDPEYFRLRESSEGKIQELMNGSLTGGEREEISRALAQQDHAQGVANTPSNLNVVENAMQYGSMARNRLAQGVALATGSLPAFRSNVDTFQQATGRSSAMNTGESRTGGAMQGMGQQAAQQSSQLLGQIGENARQSNDINSGKYNKLKKSPMEQISGMIGAVGSLIPA